MIAIVSSAPRESAALAALCESCGWAVRECPSVRALVRLAHRDAPRVVLVRHKLEDGYSDDVIAALSTLRLLPATRIVVLVGAGTPSSTEVRQVALGVDCVQRDPVRTDVLLAYIAKYVSAARRPQPTTVREATRTSVFSGAILRAAERTLEHRRQTVSLTPREVMLVELLAHSRGGVVTYETMYSEILGRRFRGDTSNMRVLLGKLGASTRAIGIVIRHWVDVIPKTGYRYRNSASEVT